MTPHQEIQRANSAIYMMQRAQADLGQKRSEVWSRYQDLDDRWRAVTQAIESLRSEVSEIVDREDIVPPVDIRDCKNMGQRLHKIAMVMGGQIDMNKALDVMESSWPTEPRRDVLAADIRRWIRQHPDDWVKIAPLTYRYTGYENSNGSWADEDH